MVGHENDDVGKKPKSLLGFRHLQVMMLFLGMVNLLCTRVSISIAIVAMTDSTQNNTFAWSHQKQSVLLSAFKWGYLVLKVPGGELAARYGGKVVLVCCVAITAITCLILPVAGQFGWQYVCACRAIQGLAQGLLYPAIYNLVGKWAPLDEKSRLTTIIYAGGDLGIALQLIIGGFMADYWGWPAIFYFNGILGIIWTTIYIFLGADSPQESKIISLKERSYIQHSLGYVSGQKRIKTPWKALFTSLPFFALILVNSGNGWGYWTLLTEIPTYMKHVQGVNIKTNGMVSALPYIASFLMSFVFGFLSDYVLERKWISVTACRKINNSIGNFSSAICLIALSYVSGDVVLAITLLTVGVGLGSGYLSGYMLVHLDMAPNHAGTMAGITGGVSNVISLMAPLTAGFLINDEADPAEWRKVFLLAAGVYIVTNGIFVIFGTSKRQKWNDPPIEDSTSYDPVQTAEHKSDKVV